MKRVATASILAALITSFGDAVQAGDNGGIWYAVLTDAAAESQQPQLHSDATYDSEEYDDRTGTYERGEVDTTAPYRSDDTGQTNKTPPRIGEIKEEEVDKIQTRRRAKRFGTAGLGPAALNNTGADDLSYDFYAGGVWEVNPYAAIKTIGEAVTDFNNSTIVSGRLGANFYPLNTDISPYIGGDLGLGYVFAEEDEGIGFSVGGSVGALLFRTSSTQMNVEANATAVLSEIQEDNFPYKIAGRIGILF